MQHWAKMYKIQNTCFFHKFTYTIQTIRLLILNVFLGYLAGDYMLKVNYRNIRARCEICSKLSIKLPE